jgi:hypothetical protein
VKRILFPCLLAACASIVTFAACKQGQGERCQVDEDCESDLVCNKAKNTCQTTEGGNADASIIDAVPADAPVDTPDAP